MEQPPTEWNDALELILKKEGEQAEAFYWMHNQASVLSSRYNDCIQIPAIIVATLTGFFSATSDLIPPVGIGALSVAVGILGTITSYYKFSQRAEGHRITSLWYMKTYKQIECQLALPVSQRLAATTLLQSLRDDMERVSETAPMLPEAVVKQFNEKFKNSVTSVPIVANGIDPIYVWRADEQDVTIVSPEQSNSVEESLQSHKSSNIKVSIVEV